MAQSEADNRDLEITARTLRKVEVMFITAMRYGEVIRAGD